MAEETKTTTKKRTTSKPKVEEPKPTSIEEQMAQMMAMMMAQQQQIMELIAQKNQPTQVDSVEEVQEIKHTPKRKRKTDKMTKQDLRRKYKGMDIYLTNITQGSVTYDGRNMTYYWENTGDVEVVSIEDIINMPSKFLNKPWLVIDGYENAEDVINDIVDALNLEKVYEYIDTIHDLYEDVNNVPIEDVKRAIELAEKRGYDIRLDLTVLIQRKIDSQELTNFHMISELEKLLGRKFL